MGELVLKLIDIDACGSIFKKVKMSEYKIVSLTDGTGPFYKLDTSDVLSRPHRNIYLKIGTGLYIYTENKELLDEARNWVTDIEEVEDGEYAITHKDYFIFRESFIDRSVSDRYKMVLRDITKYSKPVYTLADNNIVGSFFNNSDSICNYYNGLSYDTLTASDIFKLTNNIKAELDTMNTQLSSGSLTVKVTIQ